MDSHSVHSAWDVLTGSAGELGNVVLVIDEEYGHQGPTTAEFLLDQGKEVDLITSQETIGNFLGATTRPPLLRRLFSKKAQIFNHLEARQSATDVYLPATFGAAKCTRSDRTRVLSMPTAAVRAIRSANRCGSTD